MEEETDFLMPTSDYLGLREPRSNLGMQMRQVRYDFLNLPGSISLVWRNTLAFLERGRARTRGTERKGKTAILLLVQFLRRKKGGVSWLYGRTHRAC